MFFLIGIPIALLTNPFILFYPLILDLVGFTIPTLLYMTIKYKNSKFLFFLPIFYIMRTFNSLVFFTSFLKAMVGVENKGKFIWDTARYALGKEGSWDIQLSQ